MAQGAFGAPAVCLLLALVLSSLNVAASVLVWGNVVDFTPPVSNSLPLDCAVGRINNDTTPDILAGWYYLAWFAIQPNGSVVGPNLIAAPFAGFRAVALSDLTNDGYLDAIGLENAGSLGRVVYYRNLNGSGNFGPSVAIGQTGPAAPGPCNASPYGVAVLDVYSDGRLDVIVCDVCSGTIWRFQSGLTPGTGWSSFTVASTNGPAHLSTGDMDGDGDIDLLVSLSSPGHMAATLRNNGATGLASSVVGLFSCTGCRRAVFAQLNPQNDSYLDVVATCTGAGTVAVALGSGGGNFDSPVAVSPTISIVLALIAFDFDGDTIVDLVAGGDGGAGGSPFYFYRGRGDGTFAYGSLVYTSSSGAGANTLYATDVNRDGLADLVVNLHGASRVLYVPGLRACGNITIANGVTSIIRNPIPVNGTVLITCATGYEDANGGNGNYTCLPGGEFGFNPATVCRLRTCLGALAPLYGNVSAPNATAFSNVTFGCASGYTLTNGSAVVRCNSSGQWNSTFPSCSVVRCPAAETLSPTNGVASCVPTGSNVWTAVCSYSCNLGYGLFGSAQRTCLASGAWTGGPPGCSAVSLLTSTAAGDLPGSFIASQSGTWSMTVVTRDASSAIVLTGADTIAATVFSPSPAQFIGAYTGAGTYLITGLIGTLTGNYTVNLTINGMPMAVNPFQMQVTPAPAEGPQCTATSAAFGAEPREGTLVTVHLVLWDAYGNAVPNVPGTAVSSLKSGTLATVVSVVYGFDSTLGTAVADASMIPTAGYHVLEIAVGGKPVAGSPWILLVSADCGVGTYAAQSTGPCIPCPQDTYSNATTAPLGGCTACPLNTVTSASGSVALNNCTCERGYYSFTPGLPCLLCPLHATCAGGTAHPLSLAEYHPSPNNAALFLRCRHAQDACAAGSRCGNGFTGLMCKDCRPLHYQNPSGSCADCPAGSGSGSLMIAYVVVVIIFLAPAAAVVSVLVATKHLADGVTSVMALRARPLVSPTLNQAFIGLQIVGLIGASDLAWPPAARRAMAFANSVFSLDVASLVSDCSFSSFLSRYIVAVAMPMLFLVAAVISHLLLRVLTSCTRCADRFRISVGPLMLVLVFNVAPLAYLPLARTTLVFFDCTRYPDGKLYLDAARSIQCFGPEWTSVAPIALTATGVYVVGIPLGLGLSLVLRRKRLFTDLSMIQRYGTIYKLFKRSAYFAPVLLLLKRLVIVALSLFVSEFRGFLCASLLLVIASTGAVQHALKPYFWPRLDRFDTLITVSLSLLLLCGSVFVVEDDAERASQRNAVLALFFIALCALLSGIVYFIVVDSRDVMRARRLARQGRFAHPRERHFMDLVHGELVELEGSQVRGLVDEVELEKAWRARIGANGVRVGVQGSAEGSCSDGSAASDRDDGVEMLAPALELPAERRVPSATSTATAAASASATAASTPSASAGSLGGDASAQPAALERTGTAVIGSGRARRSRRGA